jgi:glutathione peroxidase
MKILLVSFLLSCLVFQQNSRFYSFSINTANGDTLKLNDYKGKKILFMTLGPTDKDTAQCRLLRDFQKKYSDQLVVIGVPSKESGCTISDAVAIQQYFTGKNLNIKITEPLYVGKSSAVQSPVFAWLTHIDQNKHFDKDAQEAGYKFFIDEQGTLYAVMSNLQKLDAAVINNIVNKTIPQRTSN